MRHGRDMHWMERRGWTLVPAITAPEGWPSRKIDTGMPDPDADCGQKA